MNKNFRFGVHSFLWTEKISEDDLWILPRIKELGFDAIDMMIGNPSEFPVNAFSRALSETGLEPVLTTTLSEHTNTISPVPGLRRAGVEKLKGAINVANRLNVKILAGVIYGAWGYKTNRPRTEQEWEWSLQCICEAAKYARETGSVTLAVEVINRYVTHFLNTAEDGVRYCKDSGMDNVKVHLDSFHMMIEEESFTKAIRTCGKDYLAYFHTCESHRGIPGTGMVPWREVFDVLSEVEYNGPLVIESYDPRFVQTSCNSCVWRSLAESGEELAAKGLAHFRKVLNS